MSLSIEKNIVALNVTMNDALLVKMLQPLAGLVVPSKWMPIRRTSKAVQKLSRESMVSFA